jgi:hypothetical protein
MWGSAYILSCGKKKKSGEGFSWFTHKKSLFYAQTIVMIDCLCAYLLSRLQQKEAKGRYNI